MLISLKLHLQAKLTCFSHGCVTARFTTADRVLSWLTGFEASQTDQHLEIREPTFPPKLKRSSSGAKRDARLI